MNHGEISLVPSYPAPSWDSLESALNDLANISPEFQVDIVDGEFVPAVSWPFSGSCSFERLAQYADVFSFEIDCMVRSPRQYLDALADLCVSRVIIHHTSTDDYVSCIEHAREHDYKIGIAVLPTVSFEDVRDLIVQFDYVQVMGIREVGKQGQPFAPETVTLIKQIREVFPEKEIAVDGAVNKDTIPVLLAAGANRLAPGSAIVAAPDRASAYRDLCELIENQQVE